MPAVFKWGDYGTQLRHHTTDLRQWHQVRKLSIPAAQIFLERSEAKALLEASKVIGSVEQGDGDAQPMLATKVRPRWVSATATK